MTKVRKKIGTIPINDIEQQVQQSTSAAITQMQQDVSDFIDGETAQYPEIGGTFKYIEDPEGRSEVKTDAGGKILSYRDSEGVVHELIGADIKNADINVANIETANIENINLSDTAKDTVSNIKPNDYVVPNLPKYGTINLTQETFFLEADSRVSSIDDVIPIQDYPNTNGNASLKLTTVHYYIKSTLTDNGDGTYSTNENSVKLRHFAYEKCSLNSGDNKWYANEAIRKVNGTCYYLDTLVRASYTVKRVQVLEGYSVVAPFDSELAEGASKMTNTEVMQMVGTPVIDAWTIENYDSTVNQNDDDGKRYNHRLLADIDFGYYYTKSNVPIYIKLQGQSTSAVRKHGYRITFYKKNDYKKKDKIKIGEMIRLSGYNLKAEMNTFALSSILYRIFGDIWQHRPITDRYNWDNEVNGYFHGATGTIKDFPVRFSSGGEFYGIYFFGLKKDEKNYMLDGTDEGGMFIQGSENYGNVWGATLPFNPQDFYSDELGAYKDAQGNEILSPATVAAMETWHHFINNRLYLGSDNNEYNSTELTDVDGTMYVTSTLEEGQPVVSSISATLIEFNKENACKRLDVLGWIDYFILLQVFLMSDSFHNNLVLYSDAEKKKIWPYFYDVNSAMRYDTTAVGENNPYNVDYIAKKGQDYDISFWMNFKDLYWDEIINRYAYLRQEQLSIQKITNIYRSVIVGIPDEDVVEEREKWTNYANKKSFDGAIEYLEKRLTWLDENYFI